MTRIRGSVAQKLRDEFYEQGKLLDADPATRDQAGCWLCHQRIDYVARPGTTEDSHSLDHFLPVSTHPELQLDPSGFRHSHYRCNTGRSDKMTPSTLGEAVTKWW